MEWSRLFLVPGMGHCAGGVALDSFDMLSSVVDWVEKGIAPASVTATGRALPGRSRPLCPYPQHAHYKGAAIRTTRRTSNAADASNALHNPGRRGTRSHRDPRLWRRSTRGRTRSDGECLGAGTPTLTSYRRVIITMREQ